MGGDLNGPGRLGRVRDDLARTRDSGWYGLAHLVVFVVTFVGSLGLLVVAVTVLVVWPLSFLPIHDGTARMLAGPLYLAALVGSLVVTHRVGARFRATTAAWQDHDAAHRSTPAGSPPVSLDRGPASLTDTTGQVATASTDAPLRRVGAEEVRFPVQVSPAWIVAARSPRLTGTSLSGAVVLLFLLLIAIMPSATAPPPFHLAYVATMTLGAGIRPAWLWRRFRRSWRRDGPPHLLVDRHGMTVVADGHSTHLRWSDVAWVGARANVPPRRHRLALVVRLLPSAPRPPAGYRFTQRRYEPHPRWYSHLGLVRVYDLSLLAAPAAEVTAAIAELSGGRWREDPPRRAKGSVAA